ncbi:MAG: PepSY domain-containing protein [Pseudomonadota bacterium]
MYVSKTLPVATAFALWTAAVHAQSTTDAIITQYQDMGFQYIDIEEGYTQTKVEAIMADGRKVEVVYDNDTGRILKQENDRADADERRLRGVDVDREDHDFVDASGREYDEDDDDDDRYADASEYSEDDDDDDGDDNDDDDGGDDDDDGYDD